MSKGIPGRVMIICSICKEHKELYANKMCKLCYMRKWRNDHRNEWNAWNRKYRKENSEKRKAWERKYREKNREKIEMCKRKGRKKLQQECFAAYGNKCMICGVNDSDILCIDHLNGRMPQDDLGGAGLYRYLRKKNYPKDKYQLLCRNCNWKQKLGK